MASFAPRLRQAVLSCLSQANAALTGTERTLLSRGIRTTGSVSANQDTEAKGVASHAEHVSKMGLSRAQERSEEDMASQAEKQEKANWMEREPGLGDKTKAETLPQDNLKPEGLGTTIPEIMSRPGMFDPGSLDLRAIKELKAADVTRQNVQHDGSWVTRGPPSDGSGEAPERPGKPLDEDQLQESVEKLGERRGGGEGLGEQTKWGATIGQSDPHAGARFSADERADKDFPPMHGDESLGGLEGHRKATGHGEGEPEKSPTQVGGQSQNVP